MVSCQTPEEDLCSKFGMDLKRGMLLRLARQDPQLHPDNPQKRAAIFDKYKVGASVGASCSLGVLLAGGPSAHCGPGPPPPQPGQEFVIPEAEAEWVGLTLDEAVEKQRLLEEKVSMCEHRRTDGVACAGPGRTWPRAAARGGPGEELPRWSHNLGFRVLCPLSSAC